MYAVRKVKTKSGSITVQVIHYVGHRSIHAKHIGSRKEELEVNSSKALEWIDKHFVQLSLFPDQKQKILLVDIYSNIPKLIIYKVDIEHCTYNVAQKKFNELFYIVLYSPISC